ncbi:hypothetical protein WU00_27000 [Burkholderia stagnalis]|nr:hypothetical protein WU00_27000 [Burkholderia stagnalis]
MLVERVAADAVRLLRASTVALRMAEGAHGLHVEMVLGGVAEVMVVFVPALAEGVEVAAVGARQTVRVRALPGTSLDSLARLPFAATGHVHFSLTVDGVAQKFIVSQEALEDHFGDPLGRADDPLAAFARGQDEICRVAAGKHGIGSTGPILVGTFDFGRRP